MLGLFGKGLVGLRERQQFLDPVDALGRDQAELREMSAQRIDGHGSLVDQKFPSLVQHQHGLLIRALDRHEPHLGRDIASQIAAASFASFLPRSDSKGRAVSHSVEVMSLRLWVNPSVTFAEYVCASWRGSTPSNPAGIPGDRICSLIERAEHIDEEIKALNEGKKEVFAEAKGEGFDVKVLKEILRLRKQDKDERDERDSLLDLYLSAMERAGSSQTRAA